VKNYACPFLLLLLLSRICDAFVLGVGAVELSVSVEKEKHNLGIAGAYDFNSASPSLKMQSSTYFQFGTNLGRSAEDLDEHAYLYEQSYLETSGEFDYFFPSKSIKWHNGYNSKADFVQAEEVNSTIDSNFNDIENTWSVTTGPSLTINRNDGFLIEASVNLSYLDSIDEATTEYNYDIGVLNSITPISQLGMNSRRVCSKYEVNTDNNACRIQYNIIFSTKRKNLDIKVETGTSDDGKTSTDIYSGTLDYAMNRYSGVSILSTRSISTILNNEGLIFKTSDQALSSLISTKSIEYSYKLGGRDLSISFMEQSLISGLDSKDSEVLRLNSNQRLHSKLCTYCVLSLNYDYSNFNDERYKHISSIELTKINSRNLSTSINFSQTRIKSELDVWSVGMLVTYSGRQAKLGGK